MNRMFKKVCGFLCMMISVVGIGNASALTSSYVIQFPSVQFNTDGTFSYSLKDSIRKTTSYLPGDVDKSGKVDLKDAQLATKYIAGQDISSLISDYNVDEFKTIGDLDKDGDVKAYDANKILRIALNIEKNFDYSNWTTVVSNNDIQSLKFLVINKESEFYDSVKSYYDLAETITEDNETDYNRLMQLKSQLFTKIEPYMETTNELEFSSNVGKIESDEVFLFVIANLKDGNKVTDFVSFSISNKVDWETIQKVNSETSNETSETEEVVENPKTAIVLSITGLVSILVVGSIAFKKKNIFNKI